MVLTNRLSFCPDIVSDIVRMSEKSIIVIIDVIFVVLVDTIIIVIRGIVVIIVTTHHHRTPQAMILFLERGRGPFATALLQRSVKTVIIG